MVFLLGSVFDPGVMLGRPAPGLCQAADTGDEKLRAPEKAA
jgi:hypothetical protein